MDFEDGDLGAQADGGQKDKTSIGMKMLRIFLEHEKAVRERRKVRNAGGSEAEGIKGYSQTPHQAAE
jgi:hypothetical protein